MSHDDVARERALLGALLTADVRTLYVLTREVAPSDFAHAPHREMFEALAAIARREERGSPEALAAELGRSGPVKTETARALQGIVEEIPHFASARRTLDEAIAAIPPIETEPVVVAAANVFRRRRSEVTTATFGYGIAELDALTGGLHEGEIVNVMGKPGSGRTAFAVSLAHRLAVEQGAAVVLATPLRRRNDSALDVMASLADVDRASLLGRAVRAQERLQLRFAQLQLETAPLLLDDRATLTTDELLEARTADVIVIDDVDRLSLDLVAIQQLDAAIVVMSRMGAFDRAADVVVVLRDDDPEGDVLYVEVERSPRDRRGVIEVPRSKRRVRVG